MSAARLHEYLRGEWKLVKRVEYKRGGDFGTWRGCATFEATTDHELRLAESGQFFFDENPGRGMDFRAKPLVFDMSTSPVEVRFDDGPFHTLDADAVMAGAESSFVHLCKADTYRGRMTIADTDRFCIDWVVSGPFKDGRIHHDYSRVRE